MTLTRSKIVKYSVFTALGISVLFLIFFVYKATTLSALSADRLAQIESLTQERNSLQAQLASTTNELDIASSTIATLAEELSMTSEELDELEDDYRREKNRNEEFEDQIKEITGTVEDLDKLSKTDKELLQKYSKVYFLNEHYVPESLASIEKNWLYNESLDKKVHTKMKPFLEDMLQDALDDGVEIWVVSAYRSFYEQQQVKGSYTITYGSGANAFSADQGYSEHQLGTTLDFTTSGMGGGLYASFENTPAFQWLEKNAHKYGFTLSYPKNNVYYEYEPWHWRFVGEDLAEDLHDEEAHFYDWDQRKIDTYLIKIFD